MNVMSSSHALVTTYPMEPAAQVLQRGLLRYFRTVCPSRHNIEIPVQAMNAEGQAPETDCCLQFELPDPLDNPQAHFVVRHGGGNVCEVVGGLDADRTEHFSICMGPSSASASVERIGQFLLDELKRQVGGMVLRRLSTAGADEPGSLDDFIDPAAS